MEAGEYQQIPRGIGLLNEDDVALAAHLRFPPRGGHGSRYE